MRPTEVRVACEGRPTEVRVACEARPAEVRVACEARPAEVRAACEARPAEVRAAREVRPTEVRVACEGRPTEVRVAFEFGSAKVWGTFESGIREVHGFVECGFMEIERASAPQLVVIHRLHDGFSGFVFPFLAQSVVHDGEDGGFHGLVRCSRFDEMAGSVLDRLSQLVKRVIRAIGSQIAAQDVHHALPVSTPVGVRDVRQRVDARDARGGLVGTQLADGILHLRVDGAVLLAFFRASGLLPFLVLDHQVGHCAHAADKGQGDLDDVFRLLPGIQFQLPERHASQPAHGEKKRDDAENSPYGDRGEQWEPPHPFLAPSPCRLALLRQLLPPLRQHRRQPQPHHF